MICKIIIHQLNDQVSLNIYHDNSHLATQFILADARIIMAMYPLSAVIILTVIESAWKKARRLKHVVQ